MSQHSLRPMERTGNLIKTTHVTILFSGRPQTDIKELNARIARIVEHENQLRAEIDAIIRDLETETA